MERDVAPVVHERVVARPRRNPLRMPRLLIVLAVAVALVAGVFFVFSPGGVPNGSGSGPTPWPEDAASDQPNRKGSQSEIVPSTGADPLPPDGQPVPPPPLNEVAGAGPATEATFYLDGQPYGDGYFDLTTGNMVVWVPADAFFGAGAGSDLVEIRALEGTTYLGIPAGLQVLTSGRAWVTIEEVVVPGAGYPPLAELFLADPGPRLAALLAGASASGPVLDTAVVNGVATSLRREPVDLELAIERLDRTRAAGVAEEMRATLGTSPVTIDVWRDENGTPLRVIYPVVSGGEFRYPGADLRAVAPDVRWEIPG